MATIGTTSAALSMKLLVDTRAQRVLSAEASKDVVDFLFSLLALPVGTAVKLLGKESMVGCLGSLYGSVEKLDGTYVQPGAAKDALLHPTVLSPAVSNKSSILGLPAAALSPEATKPKNFYRCNKGCGPVGGFGAISTCGSCRGYITDAYATECPSCGSQMTTKLTLVPAESEDQVVAQAAAVVSGKGFVQGIVTYTVMDDLAVAPMSSISSITLLNTFAIKDLGALQEKTVQIGYKERLIDEMSAPAPITLGCKSVQGTSNGDDRLSSLPDAMLHHMMSFLPMPEVVHTSLLSPRWRYLWTSTPFVHIDHLDFQDDTGNWTEVDRIEKFMDQLLRLRDRTASYTTRKKLFSGAPLFPISGALLVRHYYHATAKF